MKAILMSIHPKWCEKIFNGKKTIEVRRNRPKLEPPFTVYVYCTKAKNIREDGLYLLPNDKELYLGCKEKDLGFVCWEGDFRNGKVIGSFVCDRVEEYTFSGYNARYRINDVDLAKTCLNHPELIAYGKGKFIYGWHISDLKIYDKPKELGEFRKPCGLGTGCEDCDDIYFVNCKNTLIRPPQSYYFVETNEN